MKKFSKILIISFLTVFLLAGTVFAFPFIEVEGFVDPFSAIYTDLGGNLTQVDGLEYSFIVVDDAGTGAEMNFLSLEFENDVFNSTSTAFSYEPTDWTTSFLNSTDSGYILSYAGSTAGSTIGVGEQLSFMVNAVMYTDALTDSSLWTEGQVWAQSWFAMDTMVGGDGGSTAPVPEPATMLLLGSGLIGLAGVGRKKLVKKS